MDWKELYNRVKEDLKVKTNGKTAENYIRDLEACDFSDKPNRDTIDKLIVEWSQKGLSNNTMRRRFAAIKWVFNHYPREFDPAEVQECKNEMKLKGEVPEPTCAEKEEVEKVIAAADQRTALAIGMMFYAGMRISEVTRCKLSHWDIQSSTPTLLIPDRDDMNGKTIKTKTSRARRVIIMPTLQRLFEEYVNGDRQKVTKDLTHYNGRSMGQIYDYDKDGLLLGYKGNLKARSLRANVDSVCDSCGCPKLHPHAFRHGMATAMAELEAPIDMIANILGHTNINTTRRYIHRKTQDVATDMMKALE